MVGEAHDGQLLKL